MKSTITLLAFILLSIIFLTTEPASAETRYNMLEKVAEAANSIARGDYQGAAGAAVPAQTYQLTPMTNAGISGSSAQVSQTSPAVGGSYLNFQPVYGARVQEGPAGRPVISHGGSVTTQLPYYTAHTSFRRRD